MVKVAAYHITKLNPMDNLAHKSRFQLSTSQSRKLFFILFYGLATSLSAQSYHVDTLCSDIELSVFDEAHVDSLSFLQIDPPAHLDTTFYMDQSGPGECSWDDFKGHFDISYWWFHADNHDGNIYLEDLPDAVTLEGASHSPTNNYKRYVASLKSIAPTSGYVAFDWDSFGGSFPHIDAFYFTVNDSCVQLSSQYVTEGHYVSWYVTKGDTISLEQVSNGTANHISTTISKFQFIPEVYKVVNRTWKFVDHYQDTTSCLQQITFLRPSLDAFEIPLNHDGYDAPFLGCDADLTPLPDAYPYFENAHGRYYLSRDTLYDFNAQYWDEEISSCGANKTIKRQWEITDHCSGVSISKSQIIKIKDESEIQINCPQDQTINVSKCAVSVFIREPSAWTDCDENISVDIDWAYGSGSKVYRDVAPGRYEITFTAKDGCGKEKVCSMWLDLIYNGSGAVTCKGDQQYALPASGRLTIPASSLVNVNPNACSTYDIEVDGSSELVLDCDDIGWTSHTVRYFNPSTPHIYQTCTVEINLTGSTGSISCPDDRTVGCTSDLTNLSIYGSPRTSGVAAQDVHYTEDRHLSACGVGHIDRTWTIKSLCGGYESCTQRITVTATNGDVGITWPLDYEVDECNATVDLHPDHFPQGYDYPKTDNSASCGQITFTYSDGAPSGSKGCQTIWRTWTAQNSCDPSWKATHTQSIDVKGASEIQISCPPDQSFNVSKCAVSVYIRQPNAWTECEEDIDVDIDWAYGSGSRVYENVAPGRYEITFTAKGRCGTEKVCSMWLDLIYDGSGAVSCKDDQYYNLPASGSLTIPASSLVNVSQSSCTSYEFEVDGASQLVLDCNDIGWSTHTIRYFDPSTPHIYQTCTVEINLTGSMGTIACPDDRTIDCSSDLSDLSIYGSPNISGVSDQDVNYTEDRQLSTCGVGYIDRTWSINSLCGGYQSCTQRITVSESYGNIVISWPSDYEVNDCNTTVDLHPDQLPDGYDYPEVGSSATCGQLSFTYTDGNPSGSEGCQTILRRWTATNSCDPSWTDTHTQNIEVKDADAPVIGAPSNQVVYNNDATCSGSFVTLIPASVQDCDPTVTVTNNSPYANAAGANASGNYPVGITEITFTAIDRCGNRASERITVEVIADGDPDLRCVGELPVELTIDTYGNAEFILSADALVTGTTSSCNGDSYIYAFSESTSDLTRTLTCNDVGLKGFDVFRFNGSEWTSCSAWVSITATNEVCPPASSYADISGYIMMEDGEAVKYANILIQGMPGVNTDDNGFYMVQQVPAGNYDIEPEKEINVRNGISGLDMVGLNRHLLGTRFFTSPYQIIAADVNNNENVSVGDLFEMNALVLGNKLELDQAWKFVPTSYVFQNPTDPFSEPFPQMINVNLTTDMTNQDFIAIKSGDINNSADPKKLGGFELTNQPLVIKVEDREISSGTTFELVLDARQEELIEGMQFTLQFNPQAISYANVVSAFGINENLVINDHEAAEGQIGVVFINYNQEIDLAPLSLKFHAHSAARLSEVIDVSANIYLPEGYINDEIRPINLLFEDSSEESSFDFTVSPNPFHAEISINIESNESSQLDINIMDIAGRIISNHTTEITQGQNIYTLKKTDFENAGIYVIRLSNATTSRWTRVVLID